MKKQIVGFILFFGVALNLQAQRISHSLNSNWQFVKGEMTDKTQWEQVNLPHSWNTADVLDDEPGYYRGEAWYKRALYIPPSWKDKEVFLHFEGVAQVAEVYVNGKKAALHQGSYNAFVVPIKSLLNFNGSHNELKVMVNNSHNENIPPLTADFTFFGGIYRDVYLVATPLVHFNMDNYASSGIFVSTPKVNEQKASVNIKGSLVNNSLVNKEILLQIKVLNKEGKVVAKDARYFQSNNHSALNFEVDLQDIAKPNLWSPENPYLYQVVSTLVDVKRNEILDELSTPLGLRWFNFDAEKGFFLNGKSYKLIGASRHQDGKGKANALSDDLHVRDVTLLKEMGANFLRVAHYPQDQAVLQACDRLGLLAAVEIPIVNQITESEAFVQNAKQMQVEMIRQNYNHPSIIIWAYMNEVLLRIKYNKDDPRRDGYIRKVVQLARELEGITRKEDPSRYTMMANHGDFELYHKAGLTQISQLLGWNLYQGWYSGTLDGFANFLDRHHKELPGKPLLVTEYGADVDPRLHTFSPQRFDKTGEYAAQYHETYLKAIMARAFVAGAAVWNLADFSSEGRAETMPHINNKGLMTIDRQPKAAYYFYQAHLLKKPFLKIADRLWTNRVGIAANENQLCCIQPVVVYTNQEKIVLEQNGKPIDTLSAVFGRIIFNVPFVHGENKLRVYALDIPQLNDVMSVSFRLIVSNLKSKDFPFESLRVSLGDQRYYMDNEGEVWLPEQAYVPGSWGYIGGEVFATKGARQSYGSAKNILNTDDDPLYATQRTGIEVFRLDVPIGQYEIGLLFAELLSGIKREELVYNLTTQASTEKAEFRSFDIEVNGKRIFENLGTNNYLEPEKAFVSKFKVMVNDQNGINIKFVPKMGTSILNALQIRKIY
jgi:beta-galactosidase